MHPRVLRELADVVAKPFSIIFEKSVRQSAVTGKREASHPFLKRVKTRTLRTIDQSVSPLCPDPMGS